MQGEDVLHDANESIRLGEKNLLQSEDAWVFLAEHLIVLNQSWLRSRVPDVVMGAASPFLFSQLEGRQDSMGPPFPACAEIPNSCRNMARFDRASGRR